MTAQEETCWLRGENGIVFEHRLPLPENISERVVKGYIARVANAAGDPFDDTPPEPAPTPAPEPSTLTAPSGDIPGTSPETPEAAGQAPELSGDIPGTSPEAAGQAPESSGDVRTAPEPSGPAAGQPPAAPGTPPAPARPTRRDRKAVWVGYVVRNVVRADGSRWTAEEADGCSVNDLADEIDRWATLHTVTFAEA